MIVHVSRLSDGTRKVLKISEITGMEGEMIMMQDLFEFKRAGLNSTGKVMGAFGPTGIRSAYTAQLEHAGFKFDSKTFRQAEK